MSRPRSITYHQIEPKYSAHLYGVTAQQLRSHIEHLTRMLPGQNGIRDYCVTFDDGHISNYEYALPILQEYAIQAIFCIPAGFVGSRHDVMTWTQLRELLSLGHRVASHTWSHLSLTACSEEQLRTELEHSRDVLQQQLGTAISDVSMPFGRWNKNVIQRCRAAGYSNVYTSEFPLRTKMVGDITVHGRLTIRRQMSASQVGALITGAGLSVFAASLPCRCRKLAKSVVGDRVYHTLWRRFAKATEATRVGTGNAS